MIIIQSQTDRHRWISGVFLDDEIGRRRLAAIPEQPGTTHAAVGVTHVYPLYIVQDDSGYRAFGQAELHVYLRAFKEEFLDCKDDEPVFNIFTLTEDYEPGTLGCDEMGYLCHSHIMPDQLSAKGIKNLIARYTR